MTEFSEQDLDRAWPTSELARLSDRDLAKLALQRALKNATFFSAQALLVVLAAPRIGLFGRFLVWASIALFGFFALHRFWAFSLTLLTLIVGPALRDVAPAHRWNWLLMQATVAAADAALYVILTLWVYGAIHSEA